MNSLVLALTATIIKKTERNLYYLTLLYLKTTNRQRETDKKDKDNVLIHSFSSVYSTGVC